MIHNNPPSSAVTIDNDTATRLMISPAVMA